MHSTALKRPRCLRLHPILRAADTVVSMQPNRRQKRRPLWRLPDPGPLPRCWISRRTQWSRSSSLSRSMLLYDVNLKDQRLNWPDAAVPTMTEPLFATRYGQPSTQRESGPVGVHTSASFFFLGMAAASLSARLPRWLGSRALRDVSHAVTAGVVLGAAPEGDLPLRSKRHTLPFTRYMVRAVLSAPEASFSLSGCASSEHDPTCPHDARPHPADL